MIDVYGLSDTFYNILKLAASDYWKQWYEKNKEHFKELVGHHKRKRRRELQEVIEEHKSIPCKKCDKTFHPAAMDLIHRDPNERKFSMREATRLIHSVERLVEEIEKCDVYCANCVKEMRVEKFLADTDGNGSRTRRRKKLKTIMEEMKSKACNDCGETYPPYVMEFDHLDGHEKVESISKMINKERPIQMILDELQKTEPICTNCHRIRTYEKSHNDDNYE